MNHCCILIGPVCCGGTCCWTDELLFTAPIPGAEDAEEPPPIGLVMTGPTAVDEDDDAPVRAGTSSLDSDADIVVVVVNAVTALVAAVVVDGKLDGGIEFDDVDEDDASIICFIGHVPC